MEKSDQERFRAEVERKEKQKMKALHEKKRSVWAGLGTFGMVGWTIAIPTVLGSALGLWMDKNHPSSISWTLTFLVAGLFIGCLMAWQWVAKENKMMHEDKDEDHE